MNEWTSRDRTYAATTTHKHTSAVIQSHSSDWRHSAWRRLTSFLRVFPLAPGEDVAGECVYSLYRMLDKAAALTGQTDVRGIHSVLVHIYGHINIISVVTHRIAPRRAVSLTKYIIVTTLNAPHLLSI